MKKVLLSVILSLMASRASADLIVNGDFEQGYTGFVTEYRQGPGDLLGAAGDYLVSFNPKDHHPSGADYGDHTTGHGLMMMVNEAGTQKLVWGETVAVLPNTMYHFSAWISSWTPPAPSQLDVLFNGSSIGVIQAPSTTGVWVPFSADWNSGSATSLAIQLRNLTTADIGGDFALDDISLTSPQAAVPEPSTLMLALAGVGVLAWVRTRRRPARGRSAT